MAAKKTTTFDDSKEIQDLIEEAEKIISTQSRRLKRVNQRNEITPQQLQNIRSELDNFITPSSTLLLEENNLIDLSETSSTISSPATSTTSISINNEDDDVLLVTDDSCGNLPNSTIIVDLCTPPPNQMRQRQRRRNYSNSSNPIESQNKNNRSQLLSPRNNKNRVVCPICLEITENPKSTKCGHIFCFDCIKQSLENRKSCPICKRPCSERQLITLFF